MSSHFDMPSEWRQRAEACYAACLWLFPTEFRREYGAQMRQGFRDRCAEVDAGTLTPTRLLGETLFDTAAGIGREHMEMQFGTFGTTKLLLAKVLLLAAVLFAVQNPIGLWAGKGFDLVSRSVDNTVLNSRLTANQRERNVFTDELISEGSASSVALASVLRQSNNEAQRLASIYSRGAVGGITPLAADGGFGRKILNGQPSAYELSLAARGCLATPGCELSHVAKRFTEVDGTNAYAWAWAYRAAFLSGDNRRQRYALAQMAEAQNYQDYEGRLTADLLRLVSSSEREQALPAVLEALALLPQDPSIPRMCEWTNLAPSVASDCDRAMRKLTKATSLVAALRGWTYLEANGVTPREREQGRQQHLRLQRMREVSAMWPQAHAETDFDNRPDEQVRAWVAAFEKGEGEIASTVRWLASNAPRGSISNGAAAVVAER